MIAHGGEIVNSEPRWPFQMRVVVICSREVPLPEERGRQELGIFHSQIAPNYRNYKVEALVEVITRFLSLCQAYFLVYLFFAVVIEELPCVFIHRNLNDP